jgi:hypothetical protein
MTIPVTQDHSGHAKPKIKSMRVVDAGPLDLYALVFASPREVPEGSTQATATPAGRQEHQAPKVDLPQPPTASGCSPCPCRLCGGVQPDKLHRVPVGVWLISGEPLGS